MFGKTVVGAVEEEGTSVCDYEYREEIVLDPDTMHLWKFIRDYNG